MHQTSKLKYEIVSSKKIMGIGNINNIKEQTLNKTFMLYSSADQQFSLQLRFLRPSIIKKIGLRLINTYRYKIRLQKKNHKLVWQTENIIESRKQQQTLNLFPDTIQETSQLVILKIFNNVIDPKPLGIRFVVFQGFCDQVQKKENNKQKMKSGVRIQEEEYIDENVKRGKARNDSKNIQKKQMFENRQKQKTPKEKLAADFSEFDKYQDRIYSLQQQPNIKRKIKYNQESFSQKQVRKQAVERKRKEEQDTQLAIALSKSQKRQYIQIENQKMQIQEDHMIEHMIKEENLPPDLENYQPISDFDQEEEERHYDIVELNDQYLQNFSDLNPKWLQAQRNAEINSNVRQQEKLSKYIKIKYLLGTQIYIDTNFPSWKYHQLQVNAKNLGCKVLNDLKDHCIAVVGQETCEKLRKKHKNWTDIKYVSTQYIMDCVKIQAKLKPSDYYIRI